VTSAFSGKFWVPSEGVAVLLAAVPSVVQATTAEIEAASAARLESEVDTESWEPSQPQPPVTAQG
jgi:hypothetical protein